MRRAALFLSAVLTCTGPAAAQDPITDLFRYKPSPFCVLDEVDAPLDESNVLRFLDLVGEMAKETQFVLITHDRRSMERGNVLYGVTMQEPGCSKLVAVHFEGLERESAA